MAHWTKTAMVAAACLLATKAATAQPPEGAGQAYVPPPEQEEQAGPDVSEFQVDADRYRRITVPVTISGSGPYRFLIDTGAQATVVTPRITTDLQIAPSGRALLVAMGSQKVVETIELDGLEFADRTLNNLTAPLLKDRHIGADGILGLDSLQDLRVLIDFREGRMAVADASELGGNTGYEIVVRARRKLGQMIITDARIDGVRTSVIIDTGAQTSHGNEALRRKLRAKLGQKMQATDVHGTAYEGQFGIVDELTIAGMKLTGVPIGYAESPVFERLGLHERPALILGMHNLRAFDRVAIDFAKQRILFDIPASVRAQHLRDRVVFPSRLGTI